MTARAGWNAQFWKIRRNLLPLQQSARYVWFECIKGLDMPYSCEQAPVKSPQSNGIAESFVKTPKRDYVHATPLPDAAAVLGLIAG